MPRTRLIIHIHAHQMGQVIALPNEKRGEVLMKALLVGNQYLSTTNLASKQEADCANQACIDGRARNGEVINTNPL